MPPPRTLAEVKSEASRLLSRGHRLASRRREFVDAVERAERRGASKEDLTRARADVVRLERSVERVIARVEGLRDLARALESE
ncbi:unnamed product [Ostreococcus tauri]|uniref:Unnamed product n=1 Tax=Ostreococcus tauri TaxID=70448 RepID=Q01GP2_OSTTA|nr:unnamed product [Ostreococcus tauri]OUS42785.1 hypothetical protein BE221DRAFT_61510 [Ostreococcus tauri]CAL50102.1 unnamed product [Ostreococcus tauri]|eukprot:XP_003074250.1 unnamed product [Ostreococcus tauri]